MKIQVKDDGKPKLVCQFCQSKDLTGNAVIICPRCKAITHEQCIKENSGCPTPGCSKSMTVIKGAPACAAAPLPAPTYVPAWRDRWMDFESARPTLAIMIRYFVITVAFALPFLITMAGLIQIHRSRGFPMASAAAIAVTIIGISGLIWLKRARY